MTRVRRLSGCALLTQPRRWRLPPWRPLIDVTIHCEEDRHALTHRARRDPDPDLRDRCRAVLLAAEGMTAPQIAKQLLRSRRTVQRWAAAYRDGGVTGLIPGKSPGRTPKLPVEQREPFKQRMLANATEADGVCTLRGEDAREILAKELGTELSLGRVYALLHGVGLSCLRPRPRHRKSDPEAQAAWLERAPLLSATFSGSTPKSASRSGSRTKRGSVSKAG